MSTSRSLRSSPRRFLLLAISVQIGVFNCTTVRQPATQIAQPVGQKVLLRLRYSGPDGSGSLRLVLHEGKDSAFDLRASDSFGRSLWRLTAVAGRVALVDHRRETRCVIDESFRLAEPALEPFPVGSIPSILLGRLPIQPGEVFRSTSSETDFRDTDGRRWTTRSENGTLQAWTLWSDQEVPTVWWRRQATGGILSHRGGGQFRWQVGVSERLTEEIVILEAPAGYRAVSCSEAQLPQFREGESPPPSLEPT